ncbi:MAG: hypothetical protein R3F17_00215 [Planctomycetota bacterium]
MRTEERRAEVAKLVGDAPVLVCDVRDRAQIERLSEEIALTAPSPAWCIRSPSPTTNAACAPSSKRTATTSASLQVSVLSFVELAGALRPHLAPTPRW